MIVAKCPLRISLCGGGSDLDSFLQKNKYGSVITFSSNIYCYISLFQDKYGYNKQKKFIINYTKREEVDQIDDIINDIARECLSYFNAEHLTLNFHSDVFSAGSGLASSSAYLLACIKAITSHKKIDLTQQELCEHAIKIERKFNPLTGLQDIFGCAIGGFKRLNFCKEGEVSHQQLDSNGNFLKNFKIYLRPTGIRRKSTSILCTLDNKKVEELLPVVEEMHHSIKSLDYVSFISAINKAWSLKKQVSPLILKDSALKEMDKSLRNDPHVLAHRLCGAGNGGFFLIFKDRDCRSKSDNDIEISVSNNGVELVEI